MKFYVKLADGTYREATNEEVLGGKTPLFIKRGEGYLALAEEPMSEDNATKVLTELSTAIKGLNDRVEQIATGQKEVDSLKDQMRKAMERGFPPPGGTVDGSNTDPKIKFAIEPGTDYDSVRAVIGPYALERQGKRLQDVFAHPIHQVDEPTRVALAQYWCLVAQCSQLRPNPRALAMFDKIYGNIKTVVGDSGNQFPIPDIVQSEIFAFAREASVILKYGRVWDMTSEKMSFPAESASASLSWGNTTSESEPTVTEVELDAEELSAYAGVRNHTLADSVSDITSWLQENMSEAAGLELDNKAFNGLGTDSPFICSGILSAACGYSVVMGAGSTAFSNLTTTFLSEMISKLDGLKKMGAAWYMNGAVIHFVRDLKDNNNRPIFYQTVGSPIADQVLGYPLRESIKCPSTSAANTAFIAFGNLQNFAVGRRLGATALDVNPYTLWTTNRTLFKLYQRWALSMALTRGFVRGLTHS